MWDGLKDVPELGEQALDDEHRTIARFLSDLQAAITTGKPISEQRLLLHEALSFLRVNCMHEEELMRREKYPNLAIHSRAHERLYTRILWLDDALTRFTPAGAQEALSAISADLFHHIENDDRGVVNWHLEYVARMPK